LARFANRYALDLSESPLWLARYFYKAKNDGSPGPPRLSVAKNPGEMAREGRGASLADLDGFRRSARVGETTVVAIVTPAVLFEQGAGVKFQVAGHRTFP
jgi:hypothetical protein